MPSLRLTPLAEKDLEGIWRYTAEHWSPRQADSYLNALFDAMTGLAAGTRQARPVVVVADYIKTTSGSHMIYARPEPDGLFIIRVLHESMDVEQHLSP
ncbi:type II toxin-antitoxin system RelE/ParE family toxin [Vannielia litorea]|uniref:type II toxin-antitoxin system RelE/ParE family toxin n=1 Tax=Vannielia litorea TaxID=1217970 RepID=UPI001C9707E5|nr:type II toxin-antitoxin system RelE/ParE family toxin [Vannielia litorea]MBY6153040.1 type II toxin-antitoxin system RelE/ParE family toxin [Vannielia litorea]